MKVSLTKTESNTLQTDTRRRGGEWKPVKLEDVMDNNDNEFDIEDRLDLRLDAEEMGDNKAAAVIETKVEERNENTSTLAIHNNTINSSSTQSSSSSTPSYECDAPIPSNSRPLQHPFSPGSSVIIPTPHRQTTNDGDIELRGILPQARVYVNSRGRTVSYFSLARPIDGTPGKGEYDNTEEGGNSSPVMLYKPNGVFSERIMNPITIHSTGDARCDIVFAYGVLVVVLAIILILIVWYPN